MIYMTENQMCEEERPEDNRYRIIICGGKSDLGKDVYDTFISAVLASLGAKDCEIVSGGCRGADLAGERYAAEHGLALSRFPADWKTFGRSAGIKRNAEMINYISQFPRSAVIAFWNGESRGTGFTIRQAEKKNIDVYIYRYTSLEKSGK